VGMAIGLVIFWFVQKKHLGDVGLPPLKGANAKAANTEPFLPEHWHRVFAIFIVVLFVIFFWAAFEQAGGLMNLYTDEKVNRFLGGWEIPTTWFQAVNPFFIVAFGPVLSVIWTVLRRGDKEPSSPMKMAIGLLLLSLGFVLMMGASKQSSAEGKAALMWVVGAYFFHTLGELCLSPVGLSFVTKLAHQRIASLMMGVWFLANAAANKLSGVIGGYSEKLGEYQVFSSIVIATAAAGVVMFIVSFPMRYLMHGADKVTDAKTHPEALAPPPAPKTEPAAA
jgi:POT family proton-dependent oligopeptide transporter